MLCKIIVIHGTGEGHRKVLARLRVIDGIRVSRTRVLRIMGENSLLSPHRRPPRPANDHDGSITTDAPNGLCSLIATSHANAIFISPLMPASPAVQSIDPIPAKGSAGAGAVKPAAAAGGGA